MEQMGIAGLADSTQAMYLREIETLNKHYNKPPDRLDAEEVRSWLLARIERGLDPNTTNVSLGALRFLYRDTLRRPEMVDGDERQPSWPVPTTKLAGISNRSEGIARMPV